MATDHTGTGGDTAARERGKAPSRWEWLPAAALLVLGAGYLALPVDHGLRNLFLFVGVGLVPGVAWRLSGRPSWNVHRIFFAASLIAYVLSNPALRPDADTLAKMAAEWPLIALGFVVSFSQSLWGMLRTHRLLVDSGVTISQYETLKLCLTGSFFSIILPGSTGGDAYRVYAITRGYSAKLAPAIASVTLDRFLGLPSLLLVVVMGVLLDYRFFMSHPVLGKFMPAIVGAGAVCLAFVGYLAFAGKSHRRPESPDAEAAASAKASGWIARLHAMIATNVKRPGTLPLALFYGFVSHMGTIASCQLFGDALGVGGVPQARYYLIVPLALIINAIPFAPGGVGQGELAMASLLDLASPGVDNLQAGVMIMLLFRLSTMAIGVVGGVLYAMGNRVPGHLAERFDAARRDSERLPAAGAAGDGDG